MGSVWLSLRADFRTHWRPLAALALLLGLIGGVVLAAAAGARRTDTAYPRLLQWAIDPELASLDHLRPGSTLHLLAVPSNPKTGSPEIRQAVPVAFRVSAVGVFDSQVVPIGPARLAEPQPGIEVNLAILGAGFAAIALLPLAVLVSAAWRAAARAQGPLGVAEADVLAGASRLAPALGRAGSMTGSLGVRMAFEPGRGRTAVPVRSALVGTTVAIAAVVAAMVFGTSLLGLVGTPHRYGQNWDQELDLGFAGVSAAAGARLVAAEPAVTGYAAGDYGQLTLDGKLVAAIGISPVHGQGYLTLLAGRYPAGQPAPKQTNGLNGSPRAALASASAGRAPFRSER